MRPHLAHIRPFMFRVVDGVHTPNAPRLNLWHNTRHVDKVDVLEILPVDVHLEQTAELGQRRVCKKNAVFGHEHGAVDAVVFPRCDAFRGPDIRAGAPCFVLAGSPFYEEICCLGNHATVCTAGSNTM